MGYGKLQVALPAPNVVNHHVRAYGAVILDRDETCIAGLFVCYSDAELIIVSAKELHFARPLVIQWGYGKLRERDDWPTGRDDSDTIPIRRPKSFGRSVVTPCGRIVVSRKLYSQLCNPGDEVQTRFSLSVAVHHDKRDRALLTDEGDAERIFCFA